MELTQIVPPGRQIIERYGPGGFRVSGTVYRGPVLVFPDRTIEWIGAAMTVAGLAPIVEHGPIVEPGGIELLLLGFGRHMQPVGAALRTVLKAAGIALEPMDTGAACRTYNLLIGEDRRVAAALLPPV